MLKYRCAAWQTFYNVFCRFLLCCVWIGLDWIQFPGHQLDWTGLGSTNRGFGLDWILSTQSSSYSGYKLLRLHKSPTGWLGWLCVYICVRTVAKFLSNQERQSQDINRTRVPVDIFIRARSFIAHNGGSLHLFRARVWEESTRPMELNCKHAARARLLPGDESQPIQLWKLRYAEQCYRLFSIQLRMLVIFTISHSAAVKIFIWSRTPIKVEEFVIMCII